MSSSSSSSSSALQIIFLLALLSGIVEMCGNVATTTTSTTNSTNSTARKRRDVYSADVIHIEMLTTLTAAGDVEFSRIENVVGPAYGELLANAHRQVATGTDGGSVLKYLINNVDCGEAQLFAQAVKDTTSFVTGATVRCNDQITTI
ncbi:unnamed protein product [Caenorhabditis sp. 36 PRJEB53466]|nr:unnamed protein product [Caenorhabditis sp. 36 PRJEB53466]